MSRAYARVFREHDGLLRTGVGTTTPRVRATLQVYAERMRWCLCLFVGATVGCATLTPEGAGVAVYRAALDTVPSRRSMPTGCHLVMATPAVDMTELDIEGQKDPFRVQRNDAAAAGANALLVLSRMTSSRRDFECPGASPITDCPPSFGASYRVVFESYTCTPEALARLTAAH